VQRRDVVLGLGCAVAAGAAYALKPRAHRALLKGVTLAKAVPITFGQWSSEHADNLVVPEPGSLTSKLYSQTLGRIYTHRVSGQQILALLAYGGTQSDDLQLHRPEVCYPAFGYEISHDAALAIPLGGGVTVPGRRLYASMTDRAEAIVYWARLGEYFPDSGGAQRVARLETAMGGYIADGILARFSALGHGPEGWVDACRFITEFIAAVPPAVRPALIGTPRARALI
jgi:EpsI family protein